MLRPYSWAGVLRTTRAEKVKLNGSRVVVHPGAAGVVLFGLLGLLAVLSPSAASARANGLAVTDCTGCHGSDNPVSVTITESLTSVALGQTVRLTVQIQALNGNKGGVYFTASPGVGKLSLVSGEPMKLSGDNGATHSSPKTSSGGFVTFNIDWTAPGQPGNVEFHAYALSANGDNSSRGDGAGIGYRSEVFGCTGKQFYQDNDGDGFGSMDSPVRLACEKPTLFATSHDDCNDSVETTYPGAPELCNKEDDNCNGQVDEGLAIVMYCADKDGDGHGVAGGATVMGCAPTKGFGLCDNDCTDVDPSIYPGATEQCNYKDDNCNGQSDEGARMTCGTGWCRRSSEGCNASLCEPGPPRAEVCNALDDDCDDVVDNGSALCGAGQTCFNGSCMKIGSFDAGSSTSVGKPDAATSTRTPDGGATPAKPSDDTTESSGCAATRRQHTGEAALWLLALLGLLTRTRRQKTFAPS